MSIDIISDYDELNSSDRLDFKPVGEYNGRKVEVLDRKARICSIQFETRQKSLFSFSHHELKPLMASCSVKRKKDGEEIEIKFKVDTRKPEPKPPEKPK